MDVVEVLIKWESPVHPASSSCTTQFSCGVTGVHVTPGVLQLPPQSPTRGQGGGGLAFAQGKLCILIGSCLMGTDGNQWFSDEVLWGLRVSIPFQAQRLQVSGATFQCRSLCVHLAGASVTCGSRVPGAGYPNLVCQLAPLLLCGSEQVSREDSFCPFQRSRRADLKPRGEWKTASLCGAVPQAKTSHRRRCFKRGLERKSHRR